MLDVIKAYSGQKRIRVIHVTGKRLYDGFMEEINSKNISPGDNIEILDYMYDAATVLSASDIVIGSAGAITIAEITVTGVPSILIPKTYTAENHQEYNARALEKEGAAKVILEKDLNGKVLINAIDEIIENKNVLRTMSLNSRKMGKTDVENIIYETMIRLVEQKSKSNK